VVRCVRGVWGTWFENEALTLFRDGWINLMARLRKLRRRRRRMCLTGGSNRLNLLSRFDGVICLFRELQLLSQENWADIYVFEWLCINFPQLKLSWASNCFLTCMHISGHHKYIW
jgi:hypothetical protein